ncbi:MAG: hypothetical protein Q8N90_00740 [bacterium]|nr:hypothetical protein [bacterium]
MKRISSLIMWVGAGMVMVEVTRMFSVVAFGRFARVAEVTPADFFLLALGVALIIAGGLTKWVLSRKPTIKG